MPPPVDYFRPFRQLRWKLTFSYAAVTVGALLIGELLLFGCLIGGALLFIQSDSFPLLLISEIRRSMTPEVAPYLERTPPDMDGLRQWVSRSGSPFVGIPVQSSTAQINDDSNTGLYVLDAQGVLLVASEDVGDQAGQPFDPATVPGSAGPVERALAGETDDRQLFARTSGLLVVAIPVVGSQADVVGVAIFTIPIQNNPLANLRGSFGGLLALVGYSLACLVVVAGSVGTLFGFITARGLARRLKQLTEASDAWSQGQFSVFVEDRSEDEIGKLSARLNRMAQQLQNLLDARQELAVVDERNRLARDLHDSAKQQAFAASAQIGAARALLDANPQAAAERLAEAERLVDALRKELSTLIMELRPVALSGRGLSAAVDDYATDWSRQSGIQAAVRVQGERALSLEIEQTLFRIAQEALANVARHSGAEQVDLWLGYDETAITLIVSDNGRGFDAGGPQRGFGLRSMHDRAHALGGDLHVESSPGAGTRVTARIPLDSLSAQESDA